MKNLIFLLFFLITTNVFCQETKKERLEKLISLSNTLNEDTAKWRVLIDIVGELHNANEFEKALKYIHKAIDLTEGKFPVLHSKALSRAAIIYRLMQDFENAKINANQALEVAEKSKDKEAILDALNVTGRIYLGLANYELAEKYFKQSNLLAKEINDRYGEALSLGNLGGTMDYQGFYPEAIKYYFESLNIYQTLKNREVEIGITYANIGIVYYFREQYKEAIEYTKKAILLHEKIQSKKDLINEYGNLGTFYYETDSIDYAIELHEKILKLVIESESLNPKNYLASYSNLASMYLEKKEYEKAEEFFSKAIRLVDNKLPYELAHIKINYSRFLFETNKIELAENEITALEPLIDRINTPEIKIDFLETKVDFNKKIGNYKKALNFFEQIVSIRDTLFNKEKAQIIEKENIRFKTTEKEKAISKLTIESQNQEIKILYLVIGVFILFLAFAGMIIYSRKLKSDMEEFINDNMGLKERIEELEKDKKYEEIGKQEIIITMVKSKLKKKIHIENIKLIKSNGNYLIIYLGDTTKIGTVRSPLKNIEQDYLTSVFFHRVHHQYIVNKKYITSYDEKSIYLQNLEFEVPISKNKRSSTIEFIEL